MDTTLGTIRIEDMRLFAVVAEAKGFTAAAKRLGISKQTLSRRITELEQALGVTLFNRTTRSVRLTDVGAAYVERCSELVRIAEEANLSVSRARDDPRGTLRLTADPVFGEAFLTELVVDYARKWPDVRIDVVLTRRRVDLIEEGFDLGFRVGQVDDPRLSAVNLGPARVRYCASPAYLAKHGKPKTPRDLERHACLVVASDGEPSRWPFRGDRRPETVAVTGRLRFTSLAMARAAAIAGLGISIFPEFACQKDVRERRLVTVLDAWLVDVGAVWLVRAAHRFPTARVRAFADLACDRFASTPPWVVAGSPRRKKR